MAAQNASVPKFGSWDNDGNVPYTQRFEVVRKGKNAGKMINPNDPQENPEAFNPISEVPDESREDNRHHLTKPPLDHDLVAHKVTTGSPLHRHGHLPSSGEERRIARAGVGPGSSIERSPRHPHYQVKAATRGGVHSPARGSSEGAHSIASNTAGTSRMRTGGRDETPEKGSSVPKFGEWDESNPSSGDGFTGIFEKVRKEKKDGPAKSPMISDDIIYTNDQDGSTGAGSKNGRVAPQIYRKKTSWNEIIRGFKSIFYAYHMKIISIAPSNPFAYECRGHSSKLSEGKHCFSYEHAKFEKQYQEHFGFCLSILC